MKQLFLLTFLLFLGLAGAAAQDTRTEVCIVYKVNTCAIDKAFNDNAAQLSEIASIINNVKSDSTLTLTEILLAGYASPEGGLKLNLRLANERLNSLERYITDEIGLPAGVKITKSSGIAWERLVDLLEKSDMARREEIIDIIRNVPESEYNSRGILVDTRRRRLMSFNGGRQWYEMNRRFFKGLRDTHVTFVVKKSEPAPPPPPAKQEVTPEPVDSVVPAPPVAKDEQQPVPPTPEKKRRPLYVALKTNMLYDAALIPNIGAEVYLCNNWSISGNWMYAWWKTDHHHRYWRTYGGDLAVRKWFGAKADAKPLTGHHIGLYGQILTYDFELSGRGYLGDRWSYAGGVEYGYSLPIARRLNIDFAAGLGYLGGKYKEYLPIDGHYVWQATKQRHWFGPTKAEVSLVWLIGHGNVNSKKGAKR